MHIPFNGKIVERYFFTNKINITVNSHEKVIFFMGTGIYLYHIGTMISHKMTVFTQGLSGPDRLRLSLIK